MPHIHAITDHQPAPGAEGVEKSTGMMEAQVMQSGMVLDAQTFVVSVDQQPAPCGKNRRTKIREMAENMDITKVERSKLLELLEEHHAAFCLEDKERGETDLVEM